MLTSKNWLDSVDDQHHDADRGVLKKVLRLQLRILLITQAAVDEFLRKKFMSH